MKNILKTKKETIDKHLIFAEKAFVFFASLALVFFTLFWPAFMTIRTGILWWLFAYLFSPLIGAFMFISLGLLNTCFDIFYIWLRGKKNE